MRGGRGRRRKVALALCALLACGAPIWPGTAQAASPHASKSANAAGRSGHGAAAQPHAPSPPPLVSGSSAYATPSSGAGGSDGEVEPETAATGEDTLVRNGLGSPFCRAVAGELPSSAASDCRTSGFVSSAAPSQDYSFDTNINTTLGISIDALLQDYLVRPIWMALVWLVHSLLVVLEWAYTLELLRGPLASGLGRFLDAAQAQFTTPWMASVLACSAALAAYQGIVRRRVAQTLGEVVAMLAMIAGAMFVIADPSGTIGALSQWAQEASAGSFGAISSGSSARPYRALAQSMEELYAAEIQAPWCFMEFGDVGWCDQPARLDPRLETAAQQIASKLQAQARKGGANGVSGEVLEHRAQLLRQARTNGAIFLALPANGPLRNSVKEEGSLLHVLCGGAEEATSCRGPTAAEAEFRANSGTLPRIAGVGVIALGVTGMLLLVGFVVVRLLEAAILSVLFLLLAPAAALAPALGETGRRAFRTWAARLLGAAAAKLLWSIVLGALLASMRILLSLQLGWLVQWLLGGALWWGVFMRRRELLTGATGHHWLQGARQGARARRGEDLAIGGTRRAGKAIRDRILRSRRRDPTRQAAKDDGKRFERDPLGRLAGDAAGRLSAPAAARRGRKDRDDKGGAASSSGGAAGSFGGAAGPSGARARSGVERLTELESAHAQALADGDRRRAVSLQLRMQRVREQLAESDRQADRAGAGRDRTATSAGAGTRRTANDAAASPQPQAARQGSARDGTQRATQRPTRDGARPPRQASGAESSAPRSATARADAPRRPADAGAADARERRANLDRDLAQRREAAQHPVLRDAIEVAQRRKRQLGWSDREEQE